MSDIELRSGMKVSYVQHSGNDAIFCAAARQSTDGEENEKRNQGLINSLLSKRHTCYDAETEVLTSRGWIRWDSIIESDEFMSKSESGVLEYQRASRIVSEPYHGDMVRVDSRDIDLLVTPNHLVYAERRSKVGWSGEFSLIPAIELTERCHRLSSVSGYWIGSAFDPVVAKFIGFFVGDGSYPRDGDHNYAGFHLKKSRKIKFLYDICGHLGWEVRETSPNKFYVTLNDQAKGFVRDCYGDIREKRVPRSIRLSDRDAILGFIDGMVSSDGHRYENGKTSISTSVGGVADVIQELCLKAGIPCHVHTSKGGMFSVSIRTERSKSPEIGRTVRDREKMVRVVPFSGMVYCATVPGGVVYVRRNGKPCWSGNSPFEHSSLTVAIEVPIFVAREWMRHRTQSYSELSLRYTEAKPVFWIPSPDHGVMPNGTKMKPGRNADNDGEVQEKVERIQTVSAEIAWRYYQEQIDLGVAEEVARAVLPVSIFTRFWATSNLVNWFRFLSLRTHDPESNVVSYPQWEINQAALQVESIVSGLFPMSYVAWVKSGRSL